MNGRLFLAVLCGGLAMLVLVCAVELVGGEQSSGIPHVARCDVDGSSAGDDYRCVDDRHDVKRIDQDG